MTKEERQIKRHKYYLRDREKVSEQGKQYRIEHPEEERARTKKYRRNNLEKINGYQKKYYDKNRELIREKARKYTKENPAKYYQSTFKSELKNNYRLTVKEFDEMVKRQDGKCGICGGYPGSRTKRLCVDHDHKTNKVRGLLCKKCNSALGLLGNNIYIVNSALDYLKKWEEKK